MFIACSCGKMVYFLDEECDNCGRVLDSGINSPEDESGQLMMSFGDSGGQMRISFND